MTEMVPYRPDEILEVLERHQVLYIVIGGLAAELRGSPYVTRDVDVTPARTLENFTKLAAALRELDAKLRIPDMEEPLVIPIDERSFEQGTTWTFVTKHGYLDIALLPDGTRGYDDLRRSATREKLTDTVTILVAALADVIRSKEAAGREKDRAVLPILRQVLERTRKMDRDERGMER
ncbi:MAG TPA: hypothetical protein VNF08_00685 [Acidimicrobiales bacterium]|nr:hypothetical protein [Acidimicrobiales bacterium]